MYVLMIFYKSFKALSWPKFVLFILYIKCHDRSRRLAELFEWHIAHINYPYTILSVKQKRITSKA